MTKMGETVTPPIEILIYDNTPIPTNIKKIPDFPNSDISSNLIILTSLNFLFDYNS